MAALVDAPLNDTPQVSLPFSKLGITLEGVREFIDRCGGRAKLEGLNVTEVNSQFQMIFTRATELSYCELLQTEGSPHVRQADVFISHAWMFIFLDTFDTLVDFFSDRPDVAIWFDLFTNNQHKALDLKFDWWTGTFQSAIETFGETVMVITPWENPHPLKRSWCLFEVYATVVTKSKFQIALSRKEKERFLHSIVEDVNAVNKMVAVISLEDSQAFKLVDSNAIKEAIRLSCGFAKVNECVFMELRKWVLQTVREAVDQRSGDALAVLVLKTALGDVLRQQGSLDEALSVYLEVFKRRVEVNGRHHRLTLAILNRLADIYYMKGMAEEATMSYMECLDHGFAISSSSESSIHQLDFSNKLMDRVLSLPCFNHVTQRSPLIEPTVSDASSLAEIKSYFLAASLYYKQARRQRALPMYLRTLELLTNTLGADHIEVVIVRHNLAALYYYENMFDLAEPLLKQSVDDFTTKLGRNHPHTLLVVQNLAYYFLSTGRLDSAQALYQNTLENVASRQGSQALGVRTMTLNLGLAKYERRDYVNALPVLFSGLALSAKDVSTHIFRSSPLGSWCAAGFFGCTKDCFTCCIPLHCCCSYCGMGHVESTLCCALGCTTCAYFCACTWPVACLQAIITDSCCSCKRR